MTEPRKPIHLAGMRRRGLLKQIAGAALALPFFELLNATPSAAAGGQAKRVIFFYFPDGVAGPSQDGQPSLWHPNGSEFDFALPQQLMPLAPFQDDCVFFTGLSMGATDSGSHPGGAKKLLTATDHGNHVSIDQLLAHSAGAGAPWRHLYLGAMANVNNASGDKHISYPSPGQSISPEDDPRTAFSLLFGGSLPQNGGNGSGEQNVDPIEVSVIDGVLDDMQRLQTQLGTVEAAKLNLHLESLREVEKRIKKLGGTPVTGASCDEPGIDTSGFGEGELYVPERFPAILRAQIDLMVLSMACGLTQVGTLQASHHTSELLMSRFEGSEMYDPGYDMRSHQASHYGPNHDPNHKEFSSFVAQRRYWVGELAYLLEQLAARPEGDGSMLDHSLVLLCSEVCDGNTHLHENMPFVLAGGGGGTVSGGRLLHTNGTRHADLLIAIAHAMGEPIGSFGDNSSGPLSGLLG